jgi:hypothetical protein
MEEATMTTSSLPQAVVGLTGVEALVSGMRLSSDRFIRFELPPNVGAEHLDLMHKDLEAITAISRKNPEAMIKALNAACAHDFGTASKVANDIGLNEENLVKRGGGQIGVAVAIGVILIVGAIVLSSGGGPSSQPVGPKPGDAGLR